MFKKVVPVNKERHALKKIKEVSGFSFASGFHIAYVTLQEFARAASIFPIVFLEDKEQDEFRPVAMLGLNAGENLFVGKDGAWRAGAYVPAYVRRYPFALAKSEQAGNFTLCVDLASPRLGPKGGQPLFDGANASELTKSAMQFCIAFEQELEATRRIMEAVHAAELLVPNQATVTRPTGSSLSLTDFLVVDEAKLGALSDEAFGKLRAAGALPLIYGHLASRAVWPALLQRLGPS